MNKIELLSPAKDLECAIAAIKCGADAVYIGAPKFGARSAVGNSIENITKLINFAHKYWAKVYVTINTILTDKEILEAQKLVSELYQIGADAVIVQDMGLLELDLPPVPLFASTQCHNNNWQKVEFLEKVGFQRAILARELSLNRIKEIKSKTNIELESFIHGALCVCYSGQCYMSYAIGGRSGNRGECAQPCRKKYSLVDSAGKYLAKDKYLLSLKDLNLSDYIKELINAGITSFKIEGRLKDENYIKNIVSFYRQKIDNVLEGTEYKRSSSGKSIIDFIPDPDKTFNRGYTDYFLNERKKEIASFKTPKSLGEYIGKVIWLDKKSFKVYSKIKINNGDGICFFDENKNLQGTVINQVKDNLITPNDISLIRKNMIIYRNLDHEFLKKLYKSKIERKILVKMKIFEKNNDLTLSAVDEDGVEACLKVSEKFDLAENKEMALNNIKRQLSKLGDTEFEVAEIDVSLDNVYFIPVKDLNESRRQLIEKLRLNREKSFIRNEIKISKNDFPYPEKNLTYKGNVLNSYARKFYERHGVIVIQSAAESGIDMRNLEVMTTKHCLKYQFNLCSKQKSQMREKIYLVDEQNKKYLLNFDCKNCEMKIIFK